MTPYWLGFLHGILTSIAAYLVLGAALFIWFERDKTAGPESE